jgi:hypothetical protein
MKIGAPRESNPNEHRVALVPETVERLVKAGHEISRKVLAYELASLIPPIQRRVQKRHQQTNWQDRWTFLFMFSHLPQKK